MQIILLLIVIIWDIERGKVNLTVEKIYEIVSALKIDAKALLPYY